MILDFGFWIVRRGLDSRLVLAARLNWLLKETDEIVAMTVASIKTLRGRR